MGRQPRARGTTEHTGVTPLRNGPSASRPWHHGWTASGVKAPVAAPG